MKTNYEKIHGIAEIINFYETLDINIRLHEVLYYNSITDHIVWMSMFRGNNSHKLFVVDV